MRRELILAALAFQLHAANLPNQISLLLDAGKNSFRVTNSGAQGGTLDLQVNLSFTISPTLVNGNATALVADTKFLTAGLNVTGTGIPANTTISSFVANTSVTFSHAATVNGVQPVTVSAPRVGVTLMPVHSPPAAGTTYTACAESGGNICGKGGTASLTTFNQQWGITYPYYEPLDASGASLTPRLIYGSTSAYEANSCDVPGVIPYVEQAVVTTSPLPHPREVIALDCWDDYSRIALRSGHAWNSVIMIVRGHNLTFNNHVRWDGKARIKVNSGSWIAMTNANTAVVPFDDTQKYFAARETSSYGTADVTSDPYSFGGFGQVREYGVTIPDGTIGQTDTTVDQRLGTTGTDGNSSGWRCLECFFTDGASKTAISQFVCVSNVCTATATGFNAVSGESVYIRAAPRSELRGPHTITTGGANTFVFTPHAAGSGGSLPRNYVIPDGTYKNPVNRNPVPNRATDQITTYAYRMLQDASAFSYPDGSVPSSPGSDVTKGGCLFNYGNESCTPGQTAQMAVPNFNYHTDNRIDAVCGDCHLGGGWDLSYLKVSNHAIRMRSMFHVLTFTQGNYIASYIRSLDPTSSPPYQAYLWNPIGQPGKYQDHYTWKKSDSTLTSIVTDGSHHAVANIPGETTDVRVNDPVYIHGVLTDTDLNTQDTSGSTFHVTAVSTHSIAFDVPSNVTGSTTYTDSGMVINMSNSDMAGAGIDKQAPFGFDEIREQMDFSDVTRFNMDKWLDPRVIPSRTQYGDWMRYFLSPTHPIDSYPTANFFSSTQYLHLQSLFTMTPGSFASYKSKAYSDYADLRPFAAYIGLGINQGVSSPPDSTDKFNYYPDAAPVWKTSQHGTFRYAIQQYAMNAMFTLATKYGVLSMNAQVSTDHWAGASSNATCYPEIGIQENGLFFNEAAPHKSKMPQESIGDGTRATWEGLTNFQYMWTAEFNDQGCHNSHDMQIDGAYIIPFSAGWEGLTPGGYESHMLPAIYSSQMGRGMADLDYHNGCSGCGQDWQRVFDRTQIVAPSYGGISSAPLNSFYWFSVTRWTEYVNTQLSRVLAALNSRTDAYWTNTFTGSGSDMTCNGAFGSWQADGTVCDLFALLLTYYKAFGVDATNLAAFKTHAEAIFTSPLDWDAEEAAGVDGDIALGASGSVATAGTHVITFSTKCPTSSGAIGQFPNVPYRIGGDAAGDYYELLYPSAVGGSGDTCTTGGTGTLTFVTARNHSGSLKIYRGFSAVNQEPNWPADLFNQPRVFKGSNMTYPRP